MWILLLVIYSFMQVKWLQDIRYLSFCIIIGCIFIGITMFGNINVMNEGLIWQDQKINCISQLYIITDCHKYKYKGGIVTTLNLIYRHFYKWISILKHEKSVFFA